MHCFTTEGIGLRAPQKEKKSITFRKRNLSKTEQFHRSSSLCKLLQHSLLTQMKNHVPGGLTFTHLPNTPTACFPCTHAFLLLFNCHSPASASVVLQTWPVKSLFHPHIVSNMLEYSSKTHISHNSNRWQEMQNLSLYFLILLPDCGAEGRLLAKQAHCCRPIAPPWINLYWRQETLLVDAWKEFQRSLWKADGKKKKKVYLFTDSHGTPDYLPNTDTHWYSMAG